MRDALELPRADLFAARRQDDGTVVTTGPAEHTVGRQIAGAPGGLLDGHWVHWTWQGETLVVTNDRHGYLPLYYVADEREVCVSPALLDVVEHTGRRRWDPLALGVFLRLGTFLGDETAFRDVRALPPHGTLTWRAGRWSVTQAPYQVAPVSLARDAALDGFIELVRAAVGRRLPRDGETAWMPITGGRDSRHLLFELHRAGVRPHCLTIAYRPPGTTEDAEVAAGLCEAMGGLRHEVVRQSGAWRRLEERKNRLLGFTSLAHSWFLSLADRMTGGGGVAYDGIGGDILSSGHTIFPDIMEHYAAGRFEAIAAKWVLPEGERYFRRVLRPEVYGAMPLEATLERVARELAPHAGMPNPIASYHMAARTRRQITVTQYGYLRRLAAVLSPFMDYQVYDFLSALPWPMFADRGFHDQAIARAFPAWARQPYAVKGATTRQGESAEHRRRAWQHLGVLARRWSSRLVNLSYVRLVNARAALTGSSDMGTPLFLMQLERETGLETA